MDEFEDIDVRPSLSVGLSSQNLARHAAMCSPAPRNQGLQGVRSGQQWSLAVTSKTVPDLPFYGSDQVEKKEERTTPRGRVCLVGRPRRNRRQLPAIRGDRTPIEPWINVGRSLRPAAAHTGTMSPRSPIGLHRSWTCNDVRQAALV